MDTPSGVITGTESAPGVYAFAAPSATTPANSAPAIATSMISGSAATGTAGRRWILPKTRHTSGHGPTRPG
jgi:hypothetical protein